MHPKVPIHLLPDRAAFGPARREFCLACGEEIELGPQAPRTYEYTVDEQLRERTAHEGAYRLCTDPD